MDHVGAASLALVGGAQDVHRDEGRDNPAAGGPQGHVRAHPSGFSTRRVAAGWRSNRSAGRIGRRTSSPVQLGQRPPSTLSAHSRQNVHSKEQIRASGEPGGRSRSQHSQLGLNSSIVVRPEWCRPSCMVSKKVGVGQWLSL
jgi:hypothetical protein